jgi:hypothetical protein
MSRFLSFVLAVITASLMACGTDPCDVELLHHLKAPSTAKITKVFDEHGANAREVGGWVDSQNAYGAMLRSGYICEVPDPDPQHPEKPLRPRIAFVEDVPASYGDLLSSGRIPTHWEAP